MTPTLSPTESDILALLRAWLLSLFPNGYEIIRAAANRVPPPQGASFAVMTPRQRQPLGCPVVLYQDGSPGQRIESLAVSQTVQLDLHGPQSADQAQLVAATFLTPATFAAFKGSAVAPLDLLSVRSEPFLDGEKQQEQCWILDLALQINQTLTTGQDFAAALAVTLVPIE